MKIEIDQSGKIEDTNKDTIIALANGISKSIFISAKDKRELEKCFRREGKRRIFIYKLFATLVFLLIKPYLNKIQTIIIDQKYPGNKDLIKNFLLQQIQKQKISNISKEDIYFQLIGKKTNAHFKAYKTAKKKLDPDIKVNTKIILQEIFK